ncbi:hypothetical protein JQX09_17625 [Sulfitobacter pseudonitzschiae]|uniref:Uncharacterized protein n=1 Tax=Pseudosulfitobacter pseudonitzschiae TaxID=1402135 RepID=A0A9Q2NRI5_9RHOB|nr:hypothetical protein [Pseudosulfitobacter pseudonitzschiae]MBM2293752.1 hypothetical protein [Pseudosulfitobacter pseudonitzschiae]MBM2298670.1 hypothetical protein [Pseudosulfitobacter pseudonitzschiae]MBM2303584.1 hypothetical protein [Pseudosulfitobacter pseudonitzschiae]MBM2313367.1 hypothetical protein [Pseudosulfitobacter pseudonitzschiae]MBM2318280.1 hypothetical protein [Pseudosulfitobacter pseudonitzschiae]
MMIMRIPGFTAIYGKCQGFLGLPAKVETVTDSVMGEVPSIVTAWQPDPTELAALNAGASIHVRLVGIDRPFPMMVSVGEPPE